MPSDNRCQDLCDEILTYTQLYLIFLFRYLTVYKARLVAVFLWHNSFIGEPTIFYEKCHRTVREENKFSFFSD